MQSPTARRLEYLLARRRCTAEGYLTRVAERHKRLGYGGMAAGKTKFSRWKRGAEPELETQIAMADLEGISPEDVIDLGWPEWLRLVVTEGDDHLYFDSPWTTAGTVKTLEKVGAPVDRRNFLITTAVGLSAMTANWATAPSAEATDAERGRRVGAETADYFEQRLAALRRLDDQVGSGEVYGAAVQELKMIRTRLKACSYTEAVGRRLYAAAAEASRSAGWTAYDSGRHAQAERHFATAMRAAASSGDPVVGINTLSFWAIQHYSTGDPQGAITLIEAALAAAPRAGSARMTAMLHARACRAHAHAGDRRAADRAANAALDAYGQAGDIADDPDCIYWFNLGEAYQLIGSSALNLKNPAQALRHFDAATTAHSSEAYNGDAFPRGYAIYLARQADARIDLNDLAGAVVAAHQAVENMGGVTSARGSSTLESLRSKLAAHSNAAPVREFLEMTC
ncbi:transcriptional regulator [Kitasatospora sp. NPDC086791]|uniref:transcriptional regulator n=1 Tax=Kitasatospora sp. NPDC086791 TaxID=3155178 RepID=UPI00341D1823